LLVIGGFIISIVDIIHFLAIIYRSVYLKDTIIFGLPYIIVIIIIIREWVKSHT